MRGLATLKRVLRSRGEPQSPPAPPAPPSAPTEAASLSKSAVLFDIDEVFAAVLRDARVATATAFGAAPNIAPLQRARLFNLVHAVRMTAAVDGLVAECGCFQGLSSYAMGRYLADEQTDYDGSGFHVFDSFAGLSELTAEDRPGDPRIPVGGRPRQAGMFAAQVDSVRAVLAAFPALQLHQGWIPAVLDEAPEGPYRLVHIDVDLHDPTRDALERLHPRLAPGGVIVCDDYGSVRWPGSRAAIDEFCARTGARMLAVSTGQAYVFAGDTTRH